MAKYSELISKFDKIRHYTRDFLVYGYHTRSDLKNDKRRSYDNEKRRIMGYLHDYIEEENTAQGKRIVINITPSEVIDNPFYALWETKSFTDNTIFLHFVLLDILTENEALSLNQIYDKYVSEYSLNSDLLDIMTMRNQLNKLVGLGIIIKQKRGKTLHYRQAPNIFSAFTIDELKQIKDLITFQANVSPLGVLGYHLKNKMRLTENALLVHHKHRYLFHTLESEMIYHALLCIKAKTKCQVKMMTRKGEKIKMVCPLKIYINQGHGRAYLIVYDYGQSNYFSLRLDKILAIKKIERAIDFERFFTKLKVVTENAWSIYFIDKPALECVHITLHIDEIKERYILRRIAHEGKHGKLIKLAPNTFRYSIDVVDTYEMLPWIRTFFGRIIKLEGTNKRAIAMFQSDFDRMLKKYNLGEIHE